MFNVCFAPLMVSARWFCTNRAQLPSDSRQPTSASARKTTHTQNRDRTTPHTGSLFAINGAYLGAWINKFDGLIFMLRHFYRFICSEGRKLSKWHYFRTTHSQPTSK